MQLIPAHIMVLQVLVRGDHFMDWWISPSWARNQPNNYRGGELDALIEERGIIEVLLTHIQIPNVYTGLAPVDMSMLMPKTGLAVNLPNALGGGFNMKVVLPR